MFSDIELREAIAERLTYDAEQGAFFRKAGFMGVVAGARIGTVDTHGKLQATFLGKRYQVAHLVWLVETGALPKEVLRHKNGDAGDARFPNLIVGTGTDAKQKAFLKKALSLFPEHDFSQARFEGVNAKVQISCPEHGVFQRAPDEYLKSVKGCPVCCVEYARERQRKTPEEKIATLMARAERERKSGKNRERQRVKREVNRAGCNAASRKHYHRTKHTEKGKAGRVCREMIARVMKQACTGRSDRTEAMHGYTVREFKLHIEQQFESWMTWGNHGRWHVDHIVPVGWLIDHGVIDPRIINALDNLRPLEAHANLRRDRRYAS